MAIAANSTHHVLFPLPPPLPPSFSPPSYWTLLQSEDIMADHPLDLATLYAHQGTLDLSTLSEITQSSQPDSRVDSPFDTGSRSKRTCVRVREQIHRLREILEGDNSLVPSPTGRSKGRSQKRVNEAEGGASAAKRSRRSGYR